MTTSIDTILGYSSIDLSSFEIRGAKSGINNARTTGPVYVDGSYIPMSNTLTGDASFSHDSSIVKGLSFDAPYAFFDSSKLRTSDTITVDKTSFTVQKLISSTSVLLDKDVGSNINGTYPVSIALGSRDYVIEPDVQKNTLYGNAHFVNNSNIVTGGAWGALTTGDFIKSYSFQNFYKISACTPIALTLSSSYQGNTATEDYTGKKSIIGNADVRYATYDVAYDNQKAKWTYDSISGYGIPTSTDYTSLADGIDLKFSHSINPSSPDIMDVATVANKIFSKKTLYDTFQYALPVVPYPETLSLKINGSVKDQFPSGNRDYVLNFTQSPIYTPPPPMGDRQVANIMFLEGVNNVQPDTTSTRIGQTLVTDLAGNGVNQLMPGSETIQLNNSLQIAYKDYMLDAHSGLLEMINSTINESIVKYVGVNYNEQVDFGLSIYLNSVKQNISFPLSPTDDVLFQAASGRLKPVNQDHPGPNDVYEVHYMAAANDPLSEVVVGYVGQTTLKTNLFPIMQNSVFLYDSSSSSYMTEGDDYVISYLTGSILLTSALAVSRSFTIIYVPLSKQVNTLTYSDGSAYCTVLDSRLGIANADGFLFSFQNSSMPLYITPPEVLRVYNETRDADYDITGFKVDGTSLKLTLNNSSIGLSSTDTVIVDYKLQQDSVEYTPVQINYLTLLAGAKYFYLEGVNLTTSVYPGSVVDLVVPGAGTQNFFGINAVSFDGSGTKLALSDAVVEEIVNPSLFITDASVSFLPFTATMAPLISGSNHAIFKNQDLSHSLRSGTLIKFSNDYYQVFQTAYNYGDTTVCLSSLAFHDYTNLTSFYYSDCPVYLEGATEIYPADSVVTLFQQPAFFLNYHNGTLSASSDSSGLYLDGSSFLYTPTQTLGDLSSAITLANIPSLTFTTYAPNWHSNKIVPASNVSVYSGSNTLFYANNALRYNGVSTTAFTQSDAGTIVLKNPLREYDRYNLDYMGRRFLDTTQVNYSYSYFTRLLAGAKVEASFQYDNLDQFYVQVLSERDFLNDVTIPRMTDEALQLSGNVGQGGSVPTDSNTGPSDGGLSGDEYRRQDADIECTIFKKIYDFFQDRVDGYKMELEAGLGFRLFNNDSTFSEEEQLSGTKSINRVFPIGYGDLAPADCNPLTGYFSSSGAYFAQGDSTVRDLFRRSRWLAQLAPLGYVPTTPLTTDCYITRAGSGNFYKIKSINSDNNLTLDQTFQEARTRWWRDNYQACGALPTYDDDGYMGPKILSSSENQTDDWGLSVGDNFICTIDGVDSTYTFTDPAPPFSPIPSQVIYTFVMPLPSGLTSPQILTQLNSGIPGLRATYEYVIDSQESYGYRSTIVLRLDGTHNTLRLSSDTINAAAISKLGFTPGAEAIGTWDRTAYSPEYILDSTESHYLHIEKGFLASMWAESNKLHRIPNELSSTTNAIHQELSYVTREIPKINTEITGTGILIAEPSISTYTDSSVAHFKATVALVNATDASNHDKTNLALDWVWPIDFISKPTVPFTGIDGSTTLVLNAPSGHDLRILNTTIPSHGTYNPVVKFQSDNSVVGGTWSPWDLSVSSQYSVNNHLIFTMATTPVISLTHGGWVTDASYVVNSTSLITFWKNGPDSSSQIYPYSTYTVANIISQINSSADITATGYSSNSWSARAFKISGGDINPSATIYYGLRDLNVNYETISDRLLSDRTNFVNNRIAYLDSNRIPYLDGTRRVQIMNDLKSEELLRTSTGEPGDLYAWANNRYNRRQGCYARLSQIEALIASNQSALKVNKGFMFRG